MEWLKKILRVLMVVLFLSGAVVFISELFGITNFPDIVEMYSLSGITVGGVMFIATTNYRRMNAEIQERIKAQHQILFKKAQKDYEREERKYQKYLKSR